MIKNFFQKLKNSTEDLIICALAVFFGCFFQLVEPKVELPGFFLGVSLISILFTIGRFLVWFEDPETEEERKREWHREQEESWFFKLSLKKRVAIGTIGLITPIAAIIFRELL